MLKKKILKSLPYLVSLLFTIFIYNIHMSEKVDSMLNENNKVISNVFLASQINYHKEIAPFARRPLTTLVIETISKTFNIKLGHSFILVNFFFLLLSGVLVYTFSEKLTSNPKHGLVNMVCYFLTFSILFIFFPPVFSYDEPLQYCFILLGLITFTQQKWLLYVLFFTLALITRETTALLVPGLILFLPGLKSSFGKIFSPKHLRLCFILLLPLLFYGIFISIFFWKQELWEATKTEFSSRVYCLFENFESKKNTVESITSIFMTLGLFSYFTIIYLKNNVASAFEQKFINAFLLTLILNTPIVVLTAFTREARLFALPLFFLWPMFRQLFGKELSLLFSFRLYAVVFRRWQYLLSFLALGILNYLFCFEVYKKIGLGENSYFTEYLFVLIFIIISHFLLRCFLQKYHNAEAYPTRE